MTVTFQALFLMKGKGRPLRPASRPHRSHEAPALDVSIVRALLDFCAELSARIKRPCDIWLVPSFW